MIYITQTVFREMVPVLFQIIGCHYTDILFIVIPHILQIMANTQYKICIMNQPLPQTFRESVIGLFITGS
jgi:hypothetical protein